MVAHRKFPIMLLQIQANPLRFLSRSFFVTFSFQLQTGMIKFDHWTVVHCLNKGGPVSNTLSNNWTVGHTLSNHWTVGYTLSNHRKVGNTLSNHWTVRYTMSNHQTVGHTLSNNHRVGEKLFNHWIVVCQTCEQLEIHWLSVRLLEKKSRILETEHLLVFFYYLKLYVTVD